MEITTLGAIQAFKNMGFWLGSTWLLADIEANFMSFVYAVLIYILVMIPSDLYMLNKAHEPTEPKP